MTQEENQAFLTTKQLAFRYGLKPKTIKNWRDRKTGPSYYQMPKLGTPFAEERTRYNLADVLAWEQAHNITPINQNQ